MTTNPNNKYQSNSYALPGDLDFHDELMRIIRVNHAGEYGAKRIYEGQLAIFHHDSHTGTVIHHMAMQEKKHLDAFERLMVQHQVRPTLLQPLWHQLGYGLGFITALLGSKAAMACTVGVEEAITEHYSRQIKKLGNQNKEISTLLEEFKQDEQDHLDLSLQEGAEEAVAYPLMKHLIKKATNVAIWLSERL
ncbi:MAG: demethoxyubiquinone hydroxylase family protein [Alphaproteobacteria bacterium]|nr:demethoxyubiquinone hydroxylase family protein [Alphaproteobacteria bacterium]